MNFIWEDSGPSPKFKVVKICFGRMTARCATDASVCPREAIWTIGKKPVACICSDFSLLLPALPFTVLSPPKLSLVLYSQILHYQKTISLSLEGFSERGIWLVEMIADTSLKPGIMGQELSLSIIPAALALTILWEILGTTLLMRFRG